MEITPTTYGFGGVIRIQNSQCVSGGTVAMGLQGDRITCGVVDAEARGYVHGSVSGDRISGTWNDGSSCPAAPRRHLGSHSLLRRGRRFRHAAMVAGSEVGQTSTPCGARKPPPSSSRS